MNRESNHIKLKFNYIFLRDFWSLFKPFWSSKERGGAAFLLFCNLLGIVIGVWATIGLNTFNKDFFDALSHFDKHAIFISLQHFSGLLMILILTSGYSSYFGSLINIRWQRWLTDDYLQ